jgi:hypothetical protein
MLLILVEGKDINNVILGKKRWMSIGVCGERERGIRN